MSFGASPNSRQQLPEDSFYNDISGIDHPIAININLDLFAFNERNPEGQNQDEIEPIIKWASPKKEDPHPKSNTSSVITPKTQSTYQHYQKGKQSDPPGKWIKSGNSINRKVLLSLKCGEESKVGDLNQSVSCNTFSVMLNGSMPAVIHNKSKLLDVSTTYLEKSYQHPKPKSHTRIFSPLKPIHHHHHHHHPPPVPPPPPTPNPTFQLYKLQHQSLIIITRLKSLQITNKIYPYQISSLRKHLVSLKTLTNTDRKLQTQFQTFILEVQSILQISSFIESSFEKIFEYQETMKGIIKEMVTSDTLMQLTKVISLKNVLKGMERIQNQFDDIVQYRSSIDKGRSGTLLQNQLTQNILKIQKVLDLFDQQQLRDTLSSTKQQILGILKSSRIMTETQREVLLEIGCQLP